MLHGIRLRDGKAEWYRNRWVRTKALEGATRIDMATGTMDLTVGLANTHVVRHAGRIMALEEASLPNLIGPDLDTLGPYDFGGRLTTPFTAHPHTCPETGEMHFFGYELVAPPFVTYHVADAAGNLVHSQPIEVGGPTMVHDFAISRNYAIFMDLPVVFDLDLAIQGTMPFQWSNEYPSRVGLLHRERARSGEQPRWFDIDPCYVFHIMNAWESADGNVVHLDAGRHASMWQGGPDAFEPCYLHRWSFDLSDGTVHEQQLDDLSHGFPRIDDRRTGLPNRYGYTVGPRPGVHECRRALSARPRRLSPLSAQRVLRAVPERDPRQRADAAGRLFRRLPAARRAVRCRRAAFALGRRRTGSGRAAARRTRRRALPDSLTWNRWRSSQDRSFRGSSARRCSSPRCASAAPSTNRARSPGSRVPATSSARFC